MIARHENWHHKRHQRRQPKSSSGRTEPHLLLRRGRRACECGGLVDVRAPARAEAKRLPRKGMGVADISLFRTPNCERSRRGTLLSAAPSAARCCASSWRKRSLQVDSGYLRGVRVSDRRRLHFPPSASGAHGTSSGHTDRGSFRGLSILFVMCCVPQRPQSSCSCVASFVARSQ
jgi:hypothetical protein